MSHIVEAKTKIKNPDRTLLRQAVEIVAGQYPGGKLQDYYYTYEHWRRSSLQQTRCTGAWGLS